MWLTLKPKAEIFVRLILAVVVLLNVLIPKLLQFLTVDVSLFRRHGARGHHLDGRLCGCVNWQSCDHPTTYLECKNRTKRKINKSEG